MLTQNLDKYKTGARTEFTWSCGKIYSLSDKNGNVFYIGSTTSKVEERLRCHISAAKTAKKTTATHIKIRELDFSVYCSIIDILWITSPYNGYFSNHVNRLLQLENKYIKQYRDLGYDLTNVVRKEKPEIRPEHIGQTFHIKDTDVKEVKND